MNPEELILAAESLGVTLRNADAWELLAHLDAVLEANKRVNLTSIVDREDAIRLHVLDSLSVVPLVDRCLPGPVADIGSGAGFPGIPVAVATDREVSLIEATQKKAVFLQAITRALSHDIRILPLRAEEVPPDLREVFSAVTTRALSSLPALVELAAPLLRMGGQLLAMKGAPDDEEIRRGDRAAEIVGFERRGMTSVEIPGESAKRTILMYERVTQSQIELPRRPGIAQKRPLA